MESLLYVPEWIEITLLVLATAFDDGSYTPQKVVKKHSKGLLQTQRNEGEEEGLVARRWRGELCGETWLSGTPIKGVCPVNKSATRAAAARSGVSVRRFTTPADTNKRPRLRPAEGALPVASPLAGTWTAAARPLGLSDGLDLNH